MKILETKIIEIPGYKGSKVEMLKKASWGSFTEIKDSLEDVGIATAMLPQLIIKWNFDDENGKPMEINAENMKRLPVNVTKYLIQEAMKDITTPLKKKTSEESVATTKDSK